ncbi:MAG: hydroxyacid dehydrogenase, partial [Pseudomonadales bacterium]|nr:hydroxyacid dehydrogenase [Pseudomonadales bacterium]
MSLEPGELVIYPGKDGRLRVQARFVVDTLWLTQKQMAELFDVQPPAISKHLKNIFETGELMEAAVVSILESTAADGKAYATRFYSLDAVIAVGYRVNSVRAT